MKGHVRKIKQRHSISDLTLLCYLKQLKSFTSNTYYKQNMLQAQKMAINDSGRYTLCEHHSLNHIIYIRIHLQCSYVERVVVEMFVEIDHINGYNTFECYFVGVSA